MVSLMVGDEFVGMFDTRGEAVVYAATHLPPGQVFSIEEL